MIRVGRVRDGMIRVPWRAATRRYEMVAKAAAVGIAVVCTASAATALAMQLAGIRPSGRLIGIAAIAAHPTMRVQIKVHLAMGGTGLGPDAANAVARLG